MRGYEIWENDSSEWQDYNSDVNTLRNTAHILIVNTCQNVHGCGGAK